MRYNRKSPLREAQISLWIDTTLVYLCNPRDFQYGGQ